VALRDRLHERGMGLIVDAAVSLEVELELAPPART